MQKLKITFLAILLGLASSSKAQHHTYLLDSLEYYAGVNGNWEKSGLTEYSHNEKDSLLSGLDIKIDTNGTRIPMTNTQFHYDGTHREWLSLQYDAWVVNTSSWFNLVYQDRTFGQYGKISESVYGFNASDSSWDFSGVDSFKYAADGKLESQYYYDYPADTFRLFYRYEFKYNNTGHLDSIIQFAQYLGNWKLARVETFLPGQDGVDTLRTFDTYNYNTGLIQTSYKDRSIFYSNGDSLLKEKLTYDKVNLNWRILNKWELLVDQSIDFKTLMFPEQLQINYFFTRTPVSGTYFVSENGVLVPRNRYIYHYHKAVPNGLEDLSSNLKLYPNPCSSTLHIDLTEYPNAKSLVIYSMLGKEIVRQKLSQNVELNVATLATGAYILHLLDESGQALSVAKFVKE